jgi:CheY-like chemotaxis protein
MPDRSGVDLVEQALRERLCSAAIILAASNEDPADLERCRELEVVDCLLKPVKQSELLDTVAGALGLSRRGDAVAAMPAWEGLAGLRILLAEDSEVNQKLARGLLETYGCRVAVANNGREALALHAQQEFDLVLMDVSMPEMDGLEATRRIRVREKNGARPVLIIAMTAHAMQGDRERCLAAGMDDYLPKPIRIQGLFEKIAAVTSAAAAAEEAAPPQEEREGVDWNEALAAVGGDVQLLEVVVEAFLEETPKLQEALRRTLDAREYKELRRAAHTLKGNLRIFGVHRAIEYAFRLEKMGEREELDQAEETLAVLAAELDPIISELSRHMAMR